MSRLFSSPNAFTLQNEGERKEVSRPAVFLIKDDTPNQVNLSFCGINMIPSGVFATTNLVSLDLSHNEISDVSSLGKLECLKHLNLRDNKIKDVRGLRTLEKLETLNLCNNEIGDVSLLCDLKNLRMLNLRNNKIKYIYGLCTLVNLKILDLAKNEVEIIPDNIYGLISLISLDLSENDYFELSTIHVLTFMKMLKVFHGKSPLLKPGPGQKI